VRPPASSAQEEAWWVLEKKDPRAFLVLLLVYLQSCGKLNNREADGKRPSGALPSSPAESGGGSRIFRFLATFLDSGSHSKSRARPE
jgi:hypothetical protein